jgi:hypothetical protein
MNPHTDPVLWRIRNNHNREEGQRTARLIAVIRDTIASSQLTREDCKSAMRNCLLSIAVHGSQISIGERTIRRVSILNVRRVYDWLSRAA